MLADHHAAATIAVKNLRRARDFYEGTLGFLLLHEEGDEAVTYRSGASELLVYRSEFAGTNRATSATWNVEHDLEGVVRELQGKGVSFEHYDLPHSRRAG